MSDFTILKREFTIFFGPEFLFSKSKLEVLEGEAGQRRNTMILILILSDATYNFRFVSLLWFIIIRNVYRTKNPSFC